ncbi:MAG: class I SAM-dependent methyltransferase [Opitutaceae bacterium]
MDIRGLSRYVNTPASFSTLMRFRPRSVSYFLETVLVLLPSLALGAGIDESRPPEARYEMRNASRDGIGKFYFGREIAQVMGHQGATWLERPEREEEERTDLLVEALGLKPGDVVADVGAGSGYFSWRMARRVGEIGKVYAVEIQQEMLDLLSANMRKRNVGDIVQPVLGTVKDPKLPEAALDLILLVDVYHEFDFPYEMTRAMVKSLAPDGRLVLVEYRGEDPSVPIKPLHKMTVAQVRREMSVHPVKFETNITTLPRQHVMIFRKKQDEPR